jgi:hypothetical protein
MAAKFQKQFRASSIGILHKVTRTCPFPLNKNTSVNAQMWLYHSHMVKEIEMSDKNDFLICGRTILDTVVYAHHEGFNEFVEEYLFQALSWLGTYDFLYWMRPAFEPVDDEFRNTDPAFQDDIDRIFAEWIKTYGIEVRQAVIREAEEGTT